MTAKINYGLALLAIFSTPVVARVDYTSEEYLKNYALSTCLAQGYHSEEVKNDAAAVASGYLEFGNYSLEAHIATRNLAKKFLAKQYGSQSGEPMITAKCIDFYHSKELRDLVNNFKDKTDN
ncbi:MULTISPECIES: T6SS amidase immunity protein Tai4 family protein [unclassified Brenneria]|uniref:T6SS amidase immunity protein Tai4 family protein n=1 Tax=unclassified Brenneria TaxID=2634434 RepID=UPI0029C17A2C|nr:MULTISPECIES: T6SS amidase immunity protein Tai4 family protein [unclassified Brenneria]MDX5627148.1 T6SS amidase immunity protein Tai4 family protein [Brenneria sp. L3-3Z]MDX5694697.1 T6SS amidase immunity protein Tai4 family protein [Brenneria sp. L4-2C]MEE3664278.1 T6SS amidase immunity protein Tai4 family protein [Brenneria sp. g21c3]